ncbi:MAG TPA: hypothetical protein VFK48_12145 [Usitatibacter sp.]|nr:hypothetical protein [Usitatibacter sp.]
MRILLSLAAVVLSGAFLLVDAVSDAAAHSSARAPAAQQSPS